MSNKLDAIVVLKGSQLSLYSDYERLPASSGLPSAAGKYRSQTIGGTRLDGRAKMDMKQDVIKTVSNEKKKIPKAKLGLAKAKETLLDQPIKSIENSCWSSTPKLTQKQRRKSISDPNSISHVSLSMQRIKISSKNAKPKIITKEYNRIESLNQDANQSQKIASEFLKKRMELIHLNQVAKQKQEEKWANKV